MPEKKNMLIRGIPLDIWERIDMLCRRRGIKRREFLEQALTFFEGGEDRRGYEQAAEKSTASKNCRLIRLWLQLKVTRELLTSKKHNRVCAQTYQHDR